MSDLNEYNVEKGLVGLGEFILLEISSESIDLEDVQQLVYLNYISTLHNSPHKPSSLHTQQHSASPSLEETLALLRVVSPGDPRGYKQREPEAK
ncbi:MAG: hypothetical protein EZS28_014557 [Streblomastix strix]|uniref:Uncharacterized protein n=1 Tax=Streblomastix strix TaxID=222440 RepID=A0A5J4W5K6_9EUKA|nr:MAG: hypothetical protein EZS28_014557 [Streblomastix strix]